MEVMRLPRSAYALGSLVSLQVFSNVTHAADLNCPSLSSKVIMKGAMCCQWRYRPRRGRFHVHVEILIHLHRSHFYLDIAYQKQHVHFWDHSGELLVLVSRWCILFAWSIPHDVAVFVSMFKLCPMTPLLHLLISLPLRGGNHDSLGSAIQ
ncbi:hypothetical protein DFH29DRAFT_948691 [Suillus ampliporus]|nr:hypothetical protein DFH29DRAFT_948691 [Suillus ampliporus]